MTVELDNIVITSDFWKKYQDIIVKEVLPYQLEVMNDEVNVNFADDPQGNGGVDKNSHAIANLKIAAGETEGHHYGFPFQDTDVYKWIEAVAYSFKFKEDKELKKTADQLIELISNAQEDDGYLSTEIQIEFPERKFKRLQQSHELYTMGHYIEAGVAYYQATGNQKALDIAKRMADCIDNNFGNEDGKIHGYDGHPEVELALARLYEATKDDSYLKLGKYFLEERGQDPKFFEKQNINDGWDNDLIEGMKDKPASYYQIDELIEDMDTAEGHAVRMVYLCTGMAYIARLTNDKKLLESCAKLWNNIVNKQMYITGNVGSTTIGESFTYNYDLPNDTMYGETCASVGMTFFARQMMKIDTRGEYGDVIEKEIFNGALSGMALDGKHFFYVNPLEADPVASKSDPTKSHVLTQRADWFGCACCPANLARLITSLDKYLYSINDDKILSHQFVANDVSFSNGISISQTNNYPWTGDIEYKINNESQNITEFGIRIPSWSYNSFTLYINDEKVNCPEIDGFVFISLESGITNIKLKLDMSVKYMQANNLVEEDFGQISVQRGPLVYCGEEVDNDSSLWLYEIDPMGNNKFTFKDQLLNGVGQIQVDARKADSDSKYSSLYREYKPANYEDKQLIMIPYYAWANRTEGQMRVWFKGKSN